MTFPCVTALLRQRFATATLSSQGRLREDAKAEPHQCPSHLQQESPFGPHIFQDARRPQPALIQDILWDMIPKIQDVILPHEHDKLLVVGAEGFVAVDESLYEPKEASVLLVFWPISSLRFSPPV